MATLGQILEDVRAGQFSPELREDARIAYSSREILKVKGDEVGFGRAHSLLWEIYDQAGMYLDAYKIIQPLGDIYLGQFRTTSVGLYRVERADDKAKKKERASARQKLMCSLAYCFSLYRRDSPQQARAKLDECEHFVNEHLIDARDNAPSPFYCWGSLARLHYFYGQVLRSESDYGGARKRFTSALDCISNRLDEQRKRLPEISPKKLAVEQLFANHCTAKVLAFGFGWTSWLQGELSKALEYLQAARVLLADSRDSYLRWQVQLFYISAGRARDGCAENIEKIVADTEECYQNLRGHPEYYIQSLRDLAVAEFRAAQLQSDNSEKISHLHKARQWVQEAMTLPLCKEKPKYWMLANAILSRIYRFEGGTANLSRARTLAEEAYAWGSDESVSPRWFSEAQITLAEDLSGSVEKTDWTRAIILLTDVVKACNMNPVIVFAGLVFLTDLYLKMGDIQNALKSWSEWMQLESTIEYDSLKKKAALVRSRVNQYKYFLVNENDNHTIDEIAPRLIRFMFDREKQRQGVDFDSRRAAERIGIDHRTYEEWEEKLKKGGPFKVQFQRAKKREHQP